MNNCACPSGSSNAKMEARRTPSSVSAGWVAVVTLMFINGLVQCADQTLSSQQVLSRNRRQTGYSNGGWSSWSRCSYGFQTSYQNGCNTNQGQSRCIRRKRCGTASGSTTSWSEWTTCTVGIRNRVRKCLDNYGNLKDCVETDRCQLYPSPRQEWSRWSTTSVPSSWGYWSACTNGAQSRSRECNIGTLKKPCIENRLCSNTASPLTQWGSWSVCINGARSRRRACGDRNTPQRDCVETQRCYNTPSPSWSNPPQSNWGQWSGCSNGVRSRSRRCDAQQENYYQCTQQSRCTVAPSSWGQWSSCYNSIKMRRRSDCNTRDNRPYCLQRVGCGDDRSGPSYNNWSAWSKCNNGYQTRTRDRCAAGQNGCTQTRKCYNNDRSQSWGEWASCQRGVQTRRRRCTNQNCPVEYRRCNNDRTGPYPQTNWMNWGAWTPCYRNVRVRTRICAGREMCKGVAYQSQQCQYNGNGRGDNTDGWSSWSQCQHLHQTRIQVCRDSDCRTIDFENRDCKDVRPQVMSLSTGNEWGLWSQWNKCDSGFTKRSRKCLSDNCQGHSDEAAPCQMQYDPRNGPSSIDSRRG